MNENSAVIKTCVGCKFYKKNTSDFCTAPVEISVVTGVPKEVLCISQRSHTGACNHEGKLWEPRVVLARPATVETHTTSSSPSLLSKVIKFFK